MFSLDHYKRSALTAYNAKMLLAQAPDYRDRLCQYARVCSDGVLRFCAIGAGLPMQVALDHSTAGTLDFGARLGLNPLIAHENEIDALCNLQSYHDLWAEYAQGAIHPLNDAETQAEQAALAAKAERDFVALCQEQEG